MCLWMRMKKTTDIAMEIHFSLRLFDMTGDHTYCLSYPSFTQARHLCYTLTHVVLVQSLDQRHIHP